MMKNPLLKGVFRHMNIWKDGYNETENCTMKVFRLSYEVFFFIISKYCYLEIVKKGENP